MNLPNFHVALLAAFFLPMQYRYAVSPLLLPQIYPAAHVRFIQETPAATSQITSLPHTRYSAVIAQDRVQTPYGTLYIIPHSPPPTVERADHSPCTME